MYSPFSKIPEESRMHLVEPFFLPGVLGGFEGLVIPGGRGSFVCRGLAVG
jgi:hypothetical protein